MSAFPLTHCRCSVAWEPPIQTTCESPTHPLVRRVVAGRTGDDLCPIVPLDPGNRILRPHPPSTGRPRPYRQSIVFSEPTLGLHLPLCPSPHAAAESPDRRYRDDPQELESGHHEIARNHYRISSYLSLLFFPLCILKPRPKATDTEPAIADHPDEKIYL